MASLQTRFWPISCKNTVKGILRKCVEFFKTQPISPEYIMVNLPSAHVTPKRPFFTREVEYARPFHVIDKLRRRSVSKAYICIGSIT